MKLSREWRDVLLSCLGTGLIGILSSYSKEMDVVMTLIVYSLFRITLKLDYIDILMQSSERTETGP